MVLFNGYSLQRRWPSWRQCPGMSLHWCVSGRGTARLQAAALLHFLSVRNTFAFYSRLCFLWRRRILRSLTRRQPLRNYVTTSFERQFFLRERLAGTLEVGNFLFRFFAAVSLCGATPLRCIESQRFLFPHLLTSPSVNEMLLDQPLKVKIFLFWKL